MLQHGPVDGSSTAARPDVSITTTHAHTQAHTSIHKHTQAHTSTHTHTHTHTYTNAHTYAHTHTHSHTLTLTPTHTHTQHAQHTQTDHKYHQRRAASLRVPRAKRSDPTTATCNFATFSPQLHAHRLHARRLNPHPTRSYRSIGGPGAALGGGNSSTGEWR